MDPPAAHVIRISPDFVAMKGDVLGRAQVAIRWLLNAGNPKKAFIQGKISPAIAPQLCTQSRF
jgi:hypothetical protein